MRSRTAIWFECKIGYEKVMEDGLQKKVTESYVVDALSFTEAEKRIMEEMSSYISGEFTIKDIKIAPYKEIFFSDEEMADRWYMQAGTLKGAVGNIERVMGTTMVDYVIASVNETTLMDVFEYGKSTEEDAKPEFEAQ